MSHVVHVDTLDIQIIDMFCGIVLCCLSSAKPRQRSMIRHAQNYDASCVIVSGLVYHTVLPELEQAQTTQYVTPSPQL